MATYYVRTDGNNLNSGTANTAGGAWATIGKAASTLTAGDTCYVQDGTYSEAEISVANSGTSGSRIVFQAQNRHLAIIATQSTNMGWSIDGKSYVTIDGFRFITGTTSPPDTASSCSIRAFATQTPHAPPTGPATTGNTGIIIQNNRIDAVASMSVGIKTNVDDTIIDGNIITYGVEALNCSSSIIRNNIIFSGSGSGGQAAALLVKGGARDCLLYNNLVRIDNANDYGLSIGGNTTSNYYDSVNAWEAERCHAFNNIVYRKAGVGVGTSVYGAGMNSANDCLIYHNVFVGASLFLTDRTTESGGVDTPGPLCDNPIIQNNIVDCGVLGVDKDATALQSNANRWRNTGTLTLDYNLFYHATNIPTQTHGVNSDPLFLDRASDWHVQADSPANGAGGAVTGISGTAALDRDGFQRLTPYDIGAYESTHGSEPLLFI